MAFRGLRLIDKDANPTFCTEGNSNIGKFQYKKKGIKGAKVGNQQNRATA